MSKSNHSEARPPLSSPIRNRVVWVFFSPLLLPILVAVLYQIDPFDPKPLPDHDLFHGSLPVPFKNTHVLRRPERVGEGFLLGPEDLAYDSEARILYTGCGDGWIKRVIVDKPVTDTVIESWVNTGGRPLGLALSTASKEVIVADAEKGLLSVSEDGATKVLTDEAEGVKFKLTDGVDVAKDGMIYFTDASYKYRLEEFIYDILEGKPHGRFLSYNPSTKETKVLAQDLYFANGVAVSADQTFVIFCETVVRRCSRYYIQGERKGFTDIFIENLPGMPDNIRYDGEGHYWITMATAITFSWKQALKYPFIRKILGMMVKYMGRRASMEKDGGALKVDLEGNPQAHYYDAEIAGMVTSGLKIGNYLYRGSLLYSYLTRFDLSKFI